MAAACVAGFTTNAVRGTLAWRGDDPQLLKHDIDGITANDAARLQSDAKTLFFDVRPAADFAQSRIHGAVSFPAEDLDGAYENLRDFLAPDVQVIVYGEATLPAVRTAEFLKARGHSVRVLEQGLPGWRERGLPLDTELAP
jgi:ArsR family transcriptional regulator